MMSAELTGCMNPLRPFSKKKKGGWNLFKAKCGKNWDIFKKPCWREGKVRMSEGAGENRSAAPLIHHSLCFEKQCVVLTSVMDYAIKP